MSKLFDNSFECLYTIAMTMADNCIGAKEMEQRFNKLHEEFQEVVEAFDNYQKADNPACKANASNEINKELSDVLFVLLHIAHKNGATAFELLHMATSKMMARMNDKDYTPKN